MGATRGQATDSEDQLLLPFPEPVAQPAPADAAHLARRSRPATPEPVAPSREPATGVAPDAVREACRRRYPRKRVALRYIRHDSVLVRVGPRADGTIRLEVNEAFRAAPAAVADALVVLHLGRPRRADRTPLRHLVHAWHLHEAPPPPSLPAERLVAGIHRDLRAHLDAVIDRHFGPLDLDVSLAPRVARRVMGRHERRRPRSLVLINPLLDHPEVEEWYLRFVLFHECLHEVIPPRARNGRIERHPREFRNLERRHPDHPRVREYELWLTGPGYARLARGRRRARA